MKDQESKKMNVNENVNEKEERGPCTSASAFCSLSSSPSHPPSSCPYLPPSHPHPPYNDPDEINLLEYIYVLVKHKWWIIGATVAGLLLGYVAALIKGPIWTATAVIAPKESDKGAPNVSGFGAFGGIVASQLGMGGNASLEKIDVVLGSRKFNAEMIEKYDLMPLVLKEVAPEAYEEKWDENAGKWKDPKNTIEVVRIAGALPANYLERNIDKNGTMSIKVSSSDSTFSHAMMNAYVEFLNFYLKDMIETDANENVRYLDAKLVTVTDPLLREKLQGLIANEVEKAMVVSKEAFEVVDPVFVRQDKKNKKLFALVFAAGLFFLNVLALVFRHALMGSDKTPEDVEYLAGIRAELGKLPFAR